MRRAGPQRVEVGLFDNLEDGQPKQDEPVSPRKVTLLFSYSNRTVATPARNGRPKRTHRSILSRILPWMVKTNSGESRIEHLSACTEQDLKSERLIIVHDFDPCYYQSGDHAVIAGLVRAGAKLIGVSGTGRGDDAFATFKRNIRGEGHMELLDKRIGFVAITDFVRRRVREAFRA